VPGTAIRIDVGIGRICQRTVDRGSLVGPECLIDGRANQRMPKRHLSSKGQEAFGLDLKGGVIGDSERLSRAPHDDRIAYWVCRRYEQQPLSTLRQVYEPTGKALLDSV
jgi:hypothetical protein